MDMHELGQYISKNWELISIAGVLVTGAAVKIRSKYKKSKEEKNQREKYGIDNTSGAYQKSIDVTLEEDPLDKITIDQFCRRRNTTDCFDLEAHVTEMYNVSAGYSGVLKDNTGTVPFICDTDYFDEAKSAMIPILLNNSMKTETPLKFCVDLEDKNFVIANITEITGKYNNQTYELKDD